MQNNGQEGGPSGYRTVTDTKNLTIHGEQKAGTLVAKTEGRVDGANAREFQDALEALMNEDVTAMVLDLENLSYISSAGLRVLLLVSKQLQGRAAKFGVCSLSGPISEVFQISGFDKIIPTHATQAEALSAFSG